MYKYIIQKAEAVTAEPDPSKHSKARSQPARSENVHLAHSFSTIQGRMKTYVAEHERGSVCENRAQKRQLDLVKAEVKENLLSVKSHEMTIHEEKG